MSYRCPQCQAGRSLEIGMALQLPPDSRSDDIFLQTLRCSACGFCGVAVYEESRRGAWNSESWEHTGYRLEEKDYLSLLALLQTCPQPGNPRCECRAHHKFGCQDPHGYWRGLDELPVGERFLLRREDEAPQ